MVGRLPLRQNRPVPPALLQRIILLAHDRVARAAGIQARVAEDAWMLRQPRAVRRSYVSAVLDGPPHPHAQEIWMLGQSDEVRTSYVREVLQPALTPPDPPSPDPGPPDGILSSGAQRTDQR